MISDIDIIALITPTNNDALVDTDLSGEDADVQAICNAAWTDAVKESWRQKLVADKSIEI